MPRIHNPHRRSYEDGKTGGRSTRPVTRDRRTVSFLLPQEERSSSPTPWSSPRDSPMEGQRRRAVSERTTKRTSTEISISTLYRGTPISSGRPALPLNTSTTVPTSSKADSTQSGMRTHRAHELSSFPSANVNVPVKSVHQQAPREEHSYYAEGPLPAMVHRLALDDILTVPFNLQWDVRDHLSRARDRNNHQVDLDREAGLPTRIKLAAIDFESREHAWLIKRWGPIIVNNQFNAITLGNILSSISGYMRETIRDAEMKELILTREDQERLDQAWHARHENTFHRVHHDVPGVYRRLDIMKGELHFQKISLLWVGDWACHISLSLMK